MESSQCGYRRTCLTGNKIVCMANNDICDHVDTDVRFLLQSTHHINAMVFCVHCLLFTFTYILHFYCPNDKVDIPFPEDIFVVGNTILIIKYLAFLIKKQLIFLLFKNPSLFFLCLYSFIFYHFNSFHDFVTFSSDITHASLLGIFSILNL
jgi:hypothetical protein